MKSEDGCGAHVPLNDSLGVLSDDALRTFWRANGGSFFGPRIEHGQMPESLLLPLLRRLIGGPSDFVCASCDGTGEVYDTHGLGPYRCPSCGHEKKIANELDDLREALECLLAFSEPKCVGDEKWIEKARALLPPNTGIERLPAAEVGQEKVRPGSPLE